MATQLFGTAEFTWTDGTGQTHALAVPLQRVRPAYRINKWTRESINLANRQTWVAGYAYEILAEIRYDDTPQSLINLLLAGARGLTVTYDDGTNTHACDLISPSGEEFAAEFDEMQQSEDWHRVEIRLRKTDGTAFTSSVF